MITIHVEAHPDRGDLRTQIDQSLAAIGFFRPPPAGTQVTAGVSDVSSDTGVVEPAAQEPTKEAAKRSTRKAADKPGPTPPADPTPDVKVQDAADEAAESSKAVEAAAAAAKVEPEELFDRNVMRNAGGEYARVYGMPAAQEDGPKIIGYPAFSRVPDDEIEKATRALRKAIAENPYNRPKVA
ncbi:hypothetical protein [Methylobacterium brachiatum]|uniref:hypothetical protein n=1 Tax=Methylobacterium brachiatum TaxID=269660 RepID=UPI0008E4F303|nr:hypothetical protein [Methylobacterium brachiatum]SFI05150.1 hypothetical protein SAMN02799642_00542 [Methylobacterium brachiatum]